MGFADQFTKQSGGGSFSSRVATGTSIVYDARFVQQGKDSWHIVDVPRSKVDAFMAKMNSDEAFSLNDYGTVVASGWGEPSDAVKAEMREKYGLFKD